MQINIVRAWKDREYRESLSEKERALLPENPVGQVELTEEELANVVGGSVLLCTIIGNCSGGCTGGGIC